MLLQDKFLRNVTLNLFMREEEIIKEKDVKFVSINIKNRGIAPSSVEADFGGVK